MYESFEHMDTGLKTFLGGAAVGLLLLLKTLYEMCSAMFYPPPGSSYNFDENGVAAPEAAPALPNPGTPAAAVIGIGAVAEPKKPKPSGEGLAFGKPRAPKQSPRTKRRDKSTDKASLLDEASDDQDDATEDEAVGKPRRGNGSNGCNGSKSCRGDNERRGRGPPPKSTFEGSSSSDEATDSLKPLTRNCPSSVVSSRASHLSDRAGSTLSRGSKATRDGFMKKLNEPHKARSGPADPAARRLAAKAPAILTCD